MRPNTPSNDPPLEKLRPVNSELGAVAPKTAARILGIGRTKLYELIETGELRSLKIGTRRLITLEAIRECIASHEVRP